MKLITGWLPHWLTPWVSLVAMHTSRYFKIRLYPVAFTIIEVMGNVSGSDVKYKRDDDGGRHMFFSKTTSSYYYMYSLTGSPMWAL